MPSLEHSCQNSRCSTLHTDAHLRIRHQIHAPQHHASQIPGVSKHFAREVVRSAEELVAIEKMAQGFGSKKITEALGVPLSTTNRWLQRTRSGEDMVPRNVGRPRGAEARVCVLFSLNLSSHFSGIALVLCVFLQLSSDEVRRVFLPRCVL